MKFLNFLIIFILLSMNLHSLTLKEAIDLALKNNYSIKSQVHEVDSSKYLIKSAKSLKMPSFFVDYSYTKLNSSKYINFTIPPYLKIKEKMTEKDYVDFVAGVRLNIYLGGLIPSNIRVQEFNLKSKMYELQELKSDIIYNTEIAYLAILELKAYKKIAEKHLQSLISHLYDVKNYYNQGLVPYVDILQTDVKVKEAKQNLTKVENSIEVAKTNLAIIMGMDPEYKFTLSNINRFNVKLNTNLNDLYKIAEKNRALLKKIKAEISKIDNLINVKKSEYKPKFIISSGYKYSQMEADVENRDTYFIKGDLKFNLDWDKAFQDVNALKEKKISLEMKYLDIKSKIFLGIKKAYKEYHTALNNLTVAKSEVKTAREYFRIIKLKYKEGLADNTDVLDAESMLTKAKMEERTDYFNVLKKYFLIKRLIGEGGV